ncbi:type 2 periplasmic-binding domain-containing protein [Anaerosacchariphilus polymeriproducens]|uniref:Extracellular solute-binding protein n=1 Tax=Anaerosacchariphilus polymeriproducens TaxID=1812858 RepID=A0A371AWG9_9FIRM|nr:extracellular solute-binding protein [Anaerosacchariphilus polymeriproducens]RDU23810.1 extracellular solute-binding protein [Anaerosacchariphilus polymeriproducens]
MKLKNVAAGMMVFVLIVSMAACGERTTTTNLQSEDTTKENQSSDETGSEMLDLEEIIPEKTVTLNVYSQVANYQGEQIGWFAKVIKDKFNVKLNIINDGTDGVFATRMESGNLGDIVIFGNDTDQYHQAIDKGMLLNWNEDQILADYGPYMNKNMTKAFEKNKKISGGKIYGFGHDVAVKKNSYGEFEYHPDIRWDLYQKIGSPNVDTLEDYVNVLKKMKEICPKSDSGKETYGVSLFNDWDGDMVMFVKATATNFFGVDEFGVGFYDAETGDFQGCLEDNGYYTRCLKFYNSLYREGLLDPDSMTQGYDGCMEDYKDGTAFFCIFGWMAAPLYNSTEHVNQGKMMLPLAAKEQDTLVYGLNTNGNNRVWAIGENTQHPELCMAIINWLCTPEGRLITEYGPKGVCWDYDEKRNALITDFGYEVKNSAELKMPEDSGYDGLWKDGCPQFNNTTWSLYTENPESNGETYYYKYWPNVLARKVSPVEKSWREATKSITSKDYLSKFKFSVSKPNTYSASIKSDELDTTYNQVTKCIKDGSWQAIYAKSDEEFNRIVEKMKTEAASYGYQQCIDWCKREAKLRKASEEK